MKKVLAILVYLLCCCSINFGNISVVSASTTYFARVTKSNANLYRNPTPSTEVENLYFVIEPTYFVEVLAYENSEFYKAKYLGITGYVRKSDIQFVSGVPATPYAEKISFRVFAQNGLNLRSSPADSGGLTNRITTVAFLETNLQYIGNISGEESVIYRGDTWYFCKYVKNDETYFGYLYAGYCDMLSPITANTEVMETTSEPTFLQNVTTPTEQESSNTFGGLSTPLQTLIIVGVCLPALLIIYLLFKPSKIMAEKSRDTSSSPTKKKRKRYRGDYYEYDD